MINHVLSMMKNVPKNNALPNTVYGQLEGGFHALIDQVQAFQRMLISTPVPKKNTKLNP